MSELIDLSMRIEEGMANSRVHPRSPLIWMCYTHGTTRFLTNTTDVEGMSPSFMNEQVLLCGHTGTHVDAPTHVDPKSNITAADISLEKLQGRGVKLDVRDTVASGKGLTVTDLQKAESAASVALSDGDIVLLQTGWAEKYYGTDPDVYLDDHPGITPAAADWLISDRSISTLAIDAPNVEAPDTQDTLDVHNRFYRQERTDPRLIIENLTNLSAMPNSICKVTAFPPPVDRATGFPVRVVVSPSDTD